MVEEAVGEEVVAALTGEEEDREAVVATKMADQTTIPDVVVGITTGTVVKEATTTKMAINRGARAIGTTEREAQGGVAPVEVARTEGAPGEVCTLTCPNITVLYILPEYIFF